VTSPYATGGGGFRFEDRVAAYYLASVLTETVARGLIGTHAELILAQRSDFGHPLDDVIIEGLSGAGERTRLSLQLKSKLTFTPADKEWRSVIEKAWETVAAPGFDPAVDRVGVGIATINARSDSHYRPVLNWARYSASGADFIRRISLPDFSHKDRTAFVEGVREVVADLLKRAVTDEEVWSVLRSFVILRFDFQAEASSADEVAVQAQLQSYLEGADRVRASDIWTYLIEAASDALPAASIAPGSSIFCGRRASCSRSFTEWRQPRSTGSVSPLLLDFPATKVCASGDLPSLPTWEGCREDPRGGRCWSCGFV